jgi:endonuclease/exonuclease/phosphatase (EEP) superfamily protein YafD
MIGGPIGVTSVSTLSIEGSDHRALLVSMLVPATG